MAGHQAAASVFTDGSYLDMYLNLLNTFNLITSVLSDISTVIEWECVVVRPYLRKNSAEDQVLTEFLQITVYHIPVRREVTVELRRGYKAYMMYQDIYEPTWRSRVDKFHLSTTGKWCRRATN